MSFSRFFTPFSTINISLVLVSIYLLSGSAAQAQVSAGQKDIAAEYEQAMKAGQTYLGDEKPEEAVAAFTAAIQKVPYAPNAYAARGLAFAALEDYDSALKDYKEALDKNPKFLEALVARGKLYQELGAIELSLPDFQAAVEEDRSNYDAVFGLAKAMILLGGGSKGVKVMDRAIKMNEENPEAYRLRGRGYASQGKLDQALVDIHKSIELDPKDHESQFALATTLMQAQEYVLALQAALESIKLFEPDEDGMPFVQGYLTKAAIHTELGKTTEDEELRKQTYQDAILDCATLLKLLPEANETASARAAAHHSQGVAERMLGEIGDAIKSFSEAIALNPELGESYFRRGICFHYIDEDDLAISDFEEAASINFNDPRAYLWQGYSYTGVGKLHEAIQAYSEAIAQSDRYTAAYVNRGLAYMQLADFEKAIDDFNEAIRLEPTEAEHYFRRGLAYNQIGDSKLASKSFANAVEFDKQHVDAHRHLSTTMARLGKNEQADEHRRIADKLDAQSGSAKPANPTDDVQSSTSS